MNKLMNALQLPEVFYYLLILLLNRSSERAAYIVFQARYIQKLRKATEVDLLLRFEASVSSY